jgi:hypothetical protein
MPDITLGEPLSFQNLGGGAAEEKFNDVLDEVLENILDPNTRAETVREITMKIKIKPSEKRDSADVIISCDPKLAPQKVFPTKIFLGRGVTGHPEAHEITASQYDLFPKAKENVTSMAAAGATGKEQP